MSDAARGEGLYMSAFAVSLEDQPGELARLCEAMADEAAARATLGDRVVTE